MNRSVNVNFGLNTCCYTRRWEEVDSWVGLSKKMGYDYIQIDSDALDPFFSGDTSYQLSVARQIKEKAIEYDVGVKGYYTGMASYRFHGISHHDESPRNRMKQWITEAMDLAIAMGTDTVGGRFDAYSVETLANPKRYLEQLDKSIALYRELALIGKIKGLKALELEQMYVPSLVPYQIAQAQDYYCRLNKENAGCKLAITVDVGHMCGHGYGNSGDDLLYTKWLKHFGAMSECIHLQQTVARASEHWPFTQHYNAQGDINIEELLEALRVSHRRWNDEPWSEYMEAEQNHVLILEYLPGTSQTENEILDALAETSNYLRRYIPKEGITL